MYQEPPTALINLLRYALISILCLEAATAAAKPTAAPRRNQPILSIETSMAEAQLNAGIVDVLYSQMDSGTDLGISSQNFEDSLNDFDSEAADDFTVPEGHLWHVSQVDVGGFGTLTGSNESVTVRFYSNNLGRPGALMAVVPNLIPATGRDTGSFTIPLNDVVTLNSGTHWVSVQATKDFNISGQWFWQERSLQAGHPAVWQNPGGGFGIDECQDWANRAHCEGTEFPDQIFQILGEDEIIFCPGLQDCPGDDLPEVVLLDFEDGNQPLVNRLYPGWLDGELSSDANPTIIMEDRGLVLELGEAYTVRIPGSQRLNVIDGFHIQMDLKINGAMSNIGTILQGGLLFQYYPPDHGNFFLFQYGNGSARYNLEGESIMVTEWNTIDLVYDSPEQAIVLKFNGEVVSSDFALAASRFGQPLQLGSVDNRLHGWTDNVRLKTSSPCFSASVDLPTDDTVSADRATFESVTGASTGLCVDDNVGELVPGDTVTVSVTDGREDQYIFFDWRRQHQDWRDLHLVSSEDIAYADRNSDDELTEGERQDAGWFRWRFESSFSFVMPNADWQAAASFVNRNDLPTVSQFPVAGPHNTGAWDDSDDNIFRCGKSAEDLSNGECHGGGATDVGAEEGTPIVATTNGTLRYECLTCGGIVAYVTEEGGDWDHYFAHMADTCFSINGEEGVNPCLGFGGQICDDEVIPAGAYQASGEMYYLEGCTSGFFEDKEIVEVGTVIGFVGRTGSAHNTGVHLHFELQRNDPTGTEYPACRASGLGTRSDMIIAYPFLFPLEATACLTDEEASQADVVVLVDTTKGMTETTAALGVHAEDLLGWLEAAVGGNLRVAVADYRDDSSSPYGSEVDYRFRARSAFSSDRSQAVAGIKSLDIGFGGDKPESVFSALIGTLRSDDGLGAWRSDADKYIVLISDAPPHLPNEPYSPFNSFADVITAIDDLKNQSSLSFYEPLLKAEGQTLAIQSVVLGDDPETLSAFARLATETGGSLSVAADETEIVDTLRDVFEQIGADANPDEENSPPLTRFARPNVERLWPPNHKFHDVEILDVTDPDGDPVRLTILGITQDESVSGSGSASPDASGLGRDVAVLRAERDGSGDGRIYEITFLATDGRGGRAIDSVRVCVPHDQRGDTCRNNGQLYDSTLR